MSIDSIFEGLTPADMGRRFTNDEDCYKQLMELKWSEGFHCIKCNHPKSVKGKKWYYKRCSNCMYDESATSNTVFHNLKFPIVKAFHMYYRITQDPKSVTTVDLAKEYDLQQRTCWFFKKKVLDAVKV